MAGILNLFFFTVGLFSATLCILPCLWWSYLRKPIQSPTEIFLWGVPLGLFCSTNAFIAVASLHISSYKISKYHTISGVFTQYIFNRMQWFLSGRGKRKMEQIWRQPVKEQDRLLKTKMKNDADTEYGKMHHFHEITSVDEFRQRHPITRNEHYREYISKLIEGETNVLTKESLKRFGITSGTTGQSKIIPMMPSRADVALTSGMALNSVIGEKFRKFSPLQKWMTTYTAPRPLSTPSRILVGPMNMYTEQQKRFIGIYNSPLAAFCILDDFASTYIHLLFSLRDPDVAVWITSLTSQIKKTMGVLEKNWRAVLDDLSYATLNKDLKISDDIREDLQAALSPEPVRANQLKQEFEQGFDGIIARVWPQLSHIVAVDIEDIKEQLQLKYAKGIPIYSAAYTATEAELGLNLWPDAKSPKYVLLPNSALYEFIPEENASEEQPKTFLLNELEKDKVYEMIITQSSGLCRYRLGDVVRVVDFHFHTPVVEFCYRTEQILNLYNENMTEVNVQCALKETVKQWSEVELANWTCAESTLLEVDLKPPEEDPEAEIKQTRELIGRESSERYYLIFLELEGKPPKLSDKHLNQLDGALQNQCDKYRIRRESGQISLPHVIIVRPGTFQKMEEFTVLHTFASYNQYKTPRKIYNPLILRSLVDSDILIEK